MLSHLSLEAEEPAEAVRQLLPVVAVGLEYDLVVGTLRSARLLSALLNSDGEFARAAELAAAALEAASGMPVNALVMDLRLILARSLLDSGDDEAALAHAVPVAQWSSLKRRTTGRVFHRATAAGRSGDAGRAADLLIEHAEHLPPRRRRGRVGRCARPPAAPSDDRAEDLMVDARLISDVGPSPTGTTTSPTSTGRRRARTWRWATSTPPRRATSKPATARRPPVRCSRACAPAWTAMICRAPGAAPPASTSCCPARPGPGTPSARRWPR